LILAGFFATPLYILQMIRHIRQKLQKFCNIVSNKIVKKHLQNYKNTATMSNGGGLFAKESNQKR